MILENNNQLKLWKIIILDFIQMLFLVRDHNLKKNCSKKNNLILIKLRENHLI